jgi:hypothetical protein
MKTPLLTAVDGLLSAMGIALLLLMVKVGVNEPSPSFAKKISYLPGTVNHHDQMIIKN